MRYIRENPIEACARKRRTLIEHRMCKVCDHGFFWHRHRRRATCSKACQSQANSERCKTIEGMCKNNNRHAGWYESPIAGKVWLESTWEVRVAKILDEAAIAWTRPKRGMLWIDAEGKPHKYYPDFHLTESDVYLDPKNPYAQARDAYKLDDVRRRHGIKLYTMDKTQLTLEYIQELMNGGNGGLVAHTDCFTKAEH